MRQSDKAPGRETAPGFFHVRDPPPRAALDAQPGENQMQFEKGQSGNPAGRPRGSRNKATILAEAMFEGETEAIIRMALDKAREGDITAIRLCLERVFPRLRDRATVFDLPPINGAPEALTALTTIVAGARGGDPTAAEGSSLTKLVDHYPPALETKAFQQRLHILYG